MIKMTGLSCVQLSLLAVLLSCDAAFGQAVRLTTAPNAATDHAERALSAMDLAILAAECDLMDVSLDAMTRAVGDGPPVSSVDLGGLLSTAPNVRRRPSQVDPAAQQAASAQARLAKRLQRLQEVWLEHNMDPALAYVAWKELVFPANRPNEAFAYAVESPLNARTSYSGVAYEVDQPKPIDCGAAALIQWARLAGQLDDLRQEVSTRKSFPGAATTTLLIEIMLADHESSPESDAESICEELATTPKSLVDNPDAELLFGHAWKILDRPAANSPTREKLLDAVFAAMKSNSTWPANKWLQFLVAKQLRESLERGDAEAFRRIADLSLSQYDAIRANNQDYVASLEAEMYREAARRAFQAGHLQLGADCLRSQGLIVTNSSDGGSQTDTFLNPVEVVAQTLLAMKPQERHTLLNELVWSMPALGLRQCSRLNASESIPAIFASQRRGDAPLPPSRQLAAENASSVSLLEWAMRDSLALGQEAGILERLAELKQRGSDDAQLGQIVLDLAQNKPLPLAALTKTAEDGTHSLKPVLGEGSEVIPLDISVIQQSLDQTDFRAAGERLLDERLESAIDRHQDMPITWLRKLKFEAQSDAQQNRITSDDLKHWVVSDETSQRSLFLGHVPTSVWLQRDDGAWGHEFGPNFSYLFLRYPLQGNVTIAFRGKDGSYQEGGATFGGLRVEFLCRRNQFRIAGVGNRSTDYIETNDMNRDAFTDYRLEPLGETLTIHAGNQGFSADSNRISTAFPFFGLCSCHCSATTFDSVKVAGDVTIPRHVDLISPSLLGWSARFKAQRLPNLAFRPESSLPATTDTDKIEFDWQVVDGMIESVSHKSSGDEAADSPAPEETALGTRREALLQCVRPLCDGEEISLEFYYEPGRFALAPSVGRIAILLSEPQVHLHWITTASGHWTGIDDQNRVVDPDAEQLRPIELKENDWNQLVIRLAGEVVTLRLNGDDVYRRPWEAEAGRNFGLFHDPTEYQVRSRNIRLTGDWPETLPDDLFETKPRAN